MFAKLRDFETVAELRSSKIFEQHAMKVICTIDDAIVNLDDMQYVNRMLQTVAQSHSSRFPNFNPEFFAVIGFLCGTPFWRPSYTYIVIIPAVIFYLGYSSKTCINLRLPFSPTIVITLTVFCVVWLWRLLFNEHFRLTARNKLN